MADIKNITIDGTTYDLKDAKAREDVSDLKEDIKDNYAKNDGYYDGMTVGNAEQIVGTVFEEDDTAYNYRTTGGAVEVGDRAYVDAITGGSLPWNQIFAPERLVGTYTYNGLTFTNNGDGSMTITGTAEQNGQGRIAPSIVIPKGHKYFFFVSNLVGSNTTFAWAFWANDGVTYISNSNYGYLLREMASDYNNVGVWLNVKAGYTYNMTFKPNVFDLTAMFGSTIADYIYSLETAHAGDGVAWFKRYFPKDYYAYHAVGMEHVNAVSARTVGFNQFDYDNAAGYIGLGENVRKTSTGVSISKSNNGYTMTRTSNNDGLAVPLGKLLAGQQYKFAADLTNVVWFYLCGVYDKDVLESSGVTPITDRVIYFQSAQSGAITFTPTKTADYVITMWSNNTNPIVAKDICLYLYWNNSRDGDYEPYNLHTYPLADLTLRGIPLIDESGNLKFDGDRYLADGTVERNKAEITYDGSSDENWDVNSNNDNCTFMNISLPNSVSVTNADTVVRCVASNLVGSPASGTNGAIGSSTPYLCAIISSNRLYVTMPVSVVPADSSAVSAFKTWLAAHPVTVVYELATPTTEEADPYQYPMVVDNWGTEAFVDGLVESGDRDVAIPVGHETKYPPNLKDKLESAANNPDADGAYILTHDGGSNTYTPLASNPTIQNIIARLEALEGGGE